MPISLTTSPWQAAVDRMSSKTVVGSRLRSAEWAQVPIALREGSFFSAGIENVRILSSMREKALQGLEQARPGGTGMDRARFVADMRSLLGAAPGDTGSLTDITSVRRLSLIWDFQAADVHGFASRKADLDPDVLDAFPAYRLIRIEDRRVPRDWYARWGVAGAQVNWDGASRREMVALKTSPIWTALSRFRRPWPPFDYSSGMGLEDVDRDETEALSLLARGQNPAERQQQLGEAAAADRQGWADNLQASVKGISEEGRGWLKAAFGDQISIEGDTVAWRGLAAEPMPAPASADVVALPEVDLLADAAAKASSREEAHAIVSLPAAAQGSLSLNPIAQAIPQVDQANAFLRTVVHKDVAPAASCKVILHSGRACYDPETATARARLGDVKTTVHEIAHHIEVSDPEVLQACRDFLRSRLAPGETARPLQKIIKGSGYSPSEIAFEDKWAELGGTAYTGKLYGASLDQASATEVLSTGLERLYLDPIGFAKRDPDFFKFILSVLRP